MLNIRRTFMSVATLVVAGGMVAVLAQQQQPGAGREPGQQPPAAGQQQGSISRGELTNVNATAKTLTVRGADKQEMQFTYNDRTDVTGAKEGVAGLASMKGSQVTVHYNKEGSNNVATKIEVSAKQE
jgi:hypothetical protein